MISEPGRAPQLRCLCLDGCAANWTFKFLRSLTHLTIARVSTGCRLSVEGLITNLDNTPQLESIHLSSVMAPAGNSEPNVSSSPSTLLPFIARIHPEDNPTNFSSSSLIQTLLSSISSVSAQTATPTTLCSFVV